MSRLSIDVNVLHEDGTVSLEWDTISGADPAVIGPWLLDVYDKAEQRLLGVVALDLTVVRHR